MNLPEIKTKSIEPNSAFTENNKSLNFCITDFWKWTLSDLVENRNRGVLAEFIVKQALNIEGNSRVEWDAYDLKKDGIKIEIKSCA